MKKVISLLIALLLTTLSVARESTPVEDAWVKLRVLAAQGTPAEAHGLNLTHRTALQQYVEESKNKLNALSRAFWDDLCTNRPEYESDHQRLIQRWELYVQEKQAMKQSIIDGLSEVIGAENSDAFLSYVAHSKRATTFGFDATDIRTDEARRQTMLSRACERGAQPS